MCLTLPAQVIAVDGARATVAFAGGRRTVSILPAPDIHPGDWCLVSAGMVVRVLDAASAQQISEAVGIATSLAGTTYAGEQP